MRTSITRVRSPGGPTARKPPVSRPRTSFVRSPVSAGLLLLLLWGSAGHAAPDPGAQLAQIRLDATEVVLGNGLRVILHEDHKAPVVGIMVTYHVGSKDETPGRHGFAHLFEHLMFQGTEHLEGDYFRPLERVGATDVNGMTDRDRTTYFQTVPKNALDLALWLESDRMAHLLGGLDQAALEKQLEVVGSEKRQRQRTAFGAVPTLIAESTYPPEHPYSRRPLGTMEDLKAATLAEIGSWYRAHYHPANALLVIAGDIDPESVRGKVERYFGAIPGKPSGPRRERWVAGRTEETRLRLRTRSGSSRLYMVWNVPEWGSPETDFLEVVGRLLTEGPASRLHRRLVERDGLAVDVTHQLVRGELGSQLILKITAGPGRALGTIEAIVEEEIATLARSGPGAEELERVSAALLGELARRSESVNGYRGKTAILAESALFRGSVSGWRTGLRRMVTAEPGRIRRVVADWLVEGAFVLEAPSAPPLRTAPGTVDRSRLPEVAETPVPDLREARRTTLPNGLNVVVVERATAPLAELSLLLDLGHAAEHSESSGITDLTLDMLSRGAGGRNRTEIAERLSALGGRLQTESDLDSSTVSLSVLSGKVPAALELLADLAIRPDFPDDELERLVARRTARIRHELATPSELALRLMPHLLYGRTHPYATSLTGLGTRSGLGRISRDALLEFHRRWFRPGSATLIAVGDVSLPELLPDVERAFGDWEPGAAPAKDVDRPTPDPAERLYVVDLPGAFQSAVVVGQLVGSRTSPEATVVDLVAEVLAGSPTSRLSLNLRRDKGWTYGVYSIPVDAGGPRPLMFYTQVRRDKTAGAIREIRRELREIVTSRPISAAELDHARGRKVLTLPGRWETNEAVARAVADLERFDLPDAYYDRYPAEIRSVTLDRIRAVAREALRPDRLVWLVIGDLGAIRDALGSLDLGEPLRVQPGSPQTP